MNIAWAALLYGHLGHERRAARRRQLHRDALQMRNLRDTSNPFEMPEHKFVAKYRLNRRLAHDLCEELRPHMRAPQRATAIPVHLKILATLHFFGHGSDQKGIAADHSAAMSQPSVSLSVQEVVQAMNVPAVLGAYIQFPRTQAARRVTIQRNFHRSQIPGVIGYVDGAHALIVAPSIHEEQYVNRHQTHSLNVQVTCDSDMIILNILARYPGSTHDSFIWANSALRDKMEELYRGGEECWLLGDSGYPHEPWLHVPIADAVPESRESNFNRAHMTDRSVVERTIGHLRNRFRCLSKHRVLEYAPVKAGQIVNACACLHNRCVRAHVPAPDDIDHEDSDSDEDDPLPPRQENGRMRDRLLLEAREVRQRIVVRVPLLPPRQRFNPQRQHQRGQR